jgi:hypothetical protein
MKIKFYYSGNNGREELVADFVQDVKTKTYIACKNKSISYQTVKKHLYAQMKLSGIGIWVKKPEEVEIFRA